MAEALRLVSDNTADGSLLGDDDALYQKLYGWYRDDKEHAAPWLKNAREAFKFRAGKQYSDAEEAELKRKLKAPVVFNMIAPMVDAVCGYEVANRQETRYIPRQIGQSGVSEVVTSAAKYLRDNTDAENEESAAFHDTVTCGVGCTETYVDFDDNEDGDYRKRRVSPLSVIVDKRARADNYADAKRVHRIHKMTIRDAMEMFPGVDREDLGCSWSDADDEGDPIQESRPDAYAGDSDNDLMADTDVIAIVETQWWEFEPYVRFVDPMTGQQQRMSEDEFTTLTERLTMLGIPEPKSAKQKRKVYQRAYLGKIILDAVKPTPVEGHFTYKFITGKRDEVAGTFYGIVEAMKDPQRFSNKFFSQIISIISSNAKGGILVEQGVFPNARKAAEDWAKDDSIVEVAQGALQAGRLQPKPQTQVNPALFQLLDFAMNMGPRVTGINLEFLGMREANQAGVLEYQRRQAGVTILATLFDNLRLYRIDEGRMTLRLIQVYLSDGRLVRIVGQEGAPFLPLNRDATLGEYEIIVDDAPTSPNQKEKTWAITQQMLPVLAPVLERNPALAAEFFKSSPLPEGLIQKLGKAMTDKPPGVDEQQEAAKAAAYAKINRDDAAAEKDKATALKTFSEVLSPFITMPPPLEGPFPVGPKPPMPPQGMGLPGLPGLPQMPGLPPLGGPPAPPSVPIIPRPPGV